MPEQGRHVDGEGKEKNKGEEMLMACGLILELR